MTDRSILLSARIQIDRHADARRLRGLPGAAQVNLRPHPWTRKRNIKVNPLQPVPDAFVSSIHATIFPTKIGCLCPKYNPNWFAKRQTQGMRLKMQPCGASLAERKRFQGERLPSRIPSLG
jgi:hypothetical protein